MHKLRLIARHEYLVTVRRKSFLWSTLLPLVLAVVSGAIGVLASGALSEKSVAIGYVDEAGLVPVDMLVREEDATPPIRYDSLLMGQEALEAGDIGVLFLIPEDFLAEPRFDVYYWEEQPTDGTWSEWNAFVREALLLDQPPAIRQRLGEGAHFKLYSLVGEELQQGDVVSLLVPVVAGFLFMIAGLMSGGYLLQVLAAEKENRTIEVLLSSVRPPELIGGKAIGLMGVALTQLAIWLGVGVLILLVTLPFIGDLPAIAIPWKALGIGVAYFLPSYALLAAVMIAAGGIGGDARQAQAISGPLTLPFMLPMFLFPVILTAPAGPLATFLTFFPPTSFLTVMFRLALGGLPIWQVLVSWLLLVGIALGTLRLASSVFRLGMLRYGQALQLSEIIAGLRGHVEKGES